MAHNVEPMDVDCIDSDFDKENTYHHSNMLPCTEKGYEELDVSELNMKLRYSITPAASPMSKSYTACADRNLDLDDTLNCSDNLTRSLNSTITRNDSVIKSLKALPLQSLPTEQFTDSNRNPVLRQLDSTLTEANNITVTISGTNDNDENLSLPSSSSSVLHTPEATTPVNDLKHEEGSPIMRGLKTVLNMFRSSQSPIPPAEEEKAKPELNTPDVSLTEVSKPLAISSTPIAAHRKDGNSSKRSSPLKESIVFNDDLEKELQWKDETTILFSQEKIPVHKLFPNNPLTSNLSTKEKPVNNLNSTVEYMDVSYNDSLVNDKTISEVTRDSKADIHVAPESDSEFVDCETTITNNASQIFDAKEKSEVLHATDDLLSVNESLKTDITQTIVPESDPITNEPVNCNTTVSIDTKPELLKQTKKLDLTIDLKTVEEKSTDQNTTISLINSLDELIEEKESSINDMKQQEIKELNKTFENKNDNLTENKINDVTQEIKNIDNIEVKIQEQLILESYVKAENVDLETVAMEATNENIQILEYSSNEECKSDMNQIEQTDTEALLENITDHKISKDVLLPLQNHTAENPIEMPPVFLEKPSEESFINKTDELTTDTKIDRPADIPLPDEDDIDKEAVSLTDIPEAINTLDIVTPNMPDIVNEKQVIPEIENKAPLSQDLKMDSIDATNTEIYESPVKTEEIHDIVEGLVINEESKTEVKLDEICLESQDIKLDVMSEQLTTTLVDAKLESEDIKTDVKGEELITTPVEAKLESQDITTYMISQVLPKTESSSIEDTPAHNIEETVAEPEVAKPQEKDPSVRLNETLTLPDIVNETTPMLNYILEPSLDNKIPVNVDYLQVIETPIIIKSETEDIQQNDNSLELVNPEVTTEIPNDGTANVTTVMGSITTQEFNETITLNNQNVDTTIDEDKHIIVESNKLDVTEEMPLDLINNETEIISNLDVIPTLDAEAPEIDDEIIVSGNNSPYVSLMAGVNTEVEPAEDNFEEIVTNFVTNANEPSSPPIRSKGYNFNFDEIDDPFATKTKIRLSPPLDTPSKVTDIDDIAKNDVPIPKKNVPNRRRSQPPERKRPPINKKKFNTTFEGKSSDKKIDIEIKTKVETDPGKSDKDMSFTMEVDEPILEKLDYDIGKTATLNETIPLAPTEPAEVIEEDHPKCLPKEIIEKETLKGEEIIKAPQDTTEKEPTKIEEISGEISSDNKSSVESVAASDVKTTSSSEQSTYYSAAASSSESLQQSRNVFNLPEIDDVNFNPFASKSKMRQSPPLDLQMENPFATKSKINSSSFTSMIQTNANKPENVSPVSDHSIVNDDKMETELMEKETAADITNTTTSSKTTIDKNLTHEINTEDEDTEEGPFLDAVDAAEKMSDLSLVKEEMMKLSEQAQSEENEAGEMFIDAAAFEFLLNQNKSNVVADSGKESLFLKFDPLFAKRISSDGVVAALNKVQKRQSTPTKTRPSLRNEASPIPGPSNLNVTFDGDMNVSQESNEDLNVTVSKPMMVVTPAVNPAVTPRNKSITPNRSNRRSITFTSPAMAVIDRLLSLSGNNSTVGQDTTMTQANREQAEADVVLMQLRELLAEKEINVYNLRSESKELKDRLASMENQVRVLEADGQERLKKINELHENLAEKTKINKSMAAVVEEYEKTIASLIAETEQDKKRHAEERVRLINERDEQTAHLASMEVSFSDLHSKYEKSKQVILSCKANEDTYKKSIKEFEESLTKMQKNYELLKQHATSKLNHANQELEKMNRAHESEVLKLNAMIKRKDLHITSLEETLAQKSKANEELTAICDELINKVG